MVWFDAIDLRVFPLSFRFILVPLFIWSPVSVYSPSFLNLIRIQRGIYYEPKVGVCHLTCDFWFTLNFIRLTCSLNLCNVAIDDLALSMLKNAAVFHQLSALVFQIRLLFKTLETILSLFSKVLSASFISSARLRGLTQELNLFLRLG